MFSYDIYGLKLCANRPVNDLLLLNRAVNCDVKVWFSAKPGWWTHPNSSAWLTRYTSDILNEASRPLLVVKQSDQGERFWFAYEDGTEFVIERSSGQIWSTWTRPLTQEDATTYLLGPILGFLLRLRGVTCLHGSAFAVGDQALALVGPAHAGKSTTAAALAQRGFPILSDDVLPVVKLRERPYVQPGYPRLRLWPDSAAMLFSEPDQLPLITPNWDKRHLDLTGEGYLLQENSLPLGAIYLLGQRSDVLPAPRIERLSPSEAVMALTANTYANYLLDKDLRAQELEFLSWLVEWMPVRRVIPHSDPDFLPSLCDHILDDYRCIDTGPTPKSP